MSDTSILAGPARPRAIPLIDRALVVLAGAAVIAGSARANYQIGLVPISGQTLAVLLVAGLLGARAGTAAVLACLAAGVAGAPVFTGGGGVHLLFGPTGGYLLGFVPGAWLAGELFDRGAGRTVGRAVGALLAADAILFAFGLAWLSLYLPAKSLLAAGLLPFIPGEAVKIALAAAVLTRARRS